MHHQFDVIFGSGNAPIQSDDKHYSSKQYQIKKQVVKRRDGYIEFIGGERRRLRPVEHSSAIGASTEISLLGTWLQLNQELELP